MESGSVLNPAVEADSILRAREVKEITGSAESLIIALKESLELQLELSLLSLRTDRHLEELLALSFVELPDSVRYAENLYLAQQIRFAQKRYDETISFGQQAVALLENVEEGMPRNLLGDIYGVQMVTADLLSLPVDALAYARLALEQARLNEDADFENFIVTQASSSRLDLENQWRDRSTVSRANRWLAAIRTWKQLDERDVTRNELLRALHVVAEAAGDDAPKRAKLYSEVVTVLTASDDLDKDQRGLAFRSARHGALAYLQANKPQAATKILDHTIKHIKKLEWAEANRRRAELQLAPLKALNIYCARKSELLSKSAIRNN